MSKNNLNASQKKLLDTITDSSIYSSNRDVESFDFPCVNDHCSGRTNEERIVGTAWKTKKSYEVFCHVCGTTEVLSKDELRTFKDKVGSEVHFAKAEKEKRTRKRKARQEEDALLELDCTNETSDE